MAEGGGRWALSLAEALALPVPAGRRSALALAHGTMSVRFYAPAGRDEQTPHDQDEIYVVARGRGRFLRAGDRVPFAPGTALFVPAGVEHRFEDFTDDFATWVVFWGPDGGEGDG